MPTILDEIVERKWEEIAAARGRVSDSTLAERIADLPPGARFRGPAAATGLADHRRGEKSLPVSWDHPCGFRSGWHRANLCGAWAPIALAC